MYIVYPPHHARHRSPAEIFNGERDIHQETPARLETIQTALEQHDFELTPVSDSNLVPESVLTGIHTQSYLDFLRKTTHLEEGTYRYPSVFQYRTSTNESSNQLAELGYYSFDLYTPVTAVTLSAAVDSATCAFQVAQKVQAGSVRVGYALGRPPGHHAEPDQMGGYCYINNAAVAAQYLSNYGTVAVLDVDFHHGNGTQSIFYNRSDVLTVSLHADPNWKFPFFSGFSEEKGTIDGENYNLNIPLGPGTNNQEYHRALEIALSAIQKFQPQYLVVSFGADTHEADPIGGFSLTTTYFRQMAQTIYQLNLPTVIVQEGGYNTSLLGENVVSFLQGFTT